MEVEPKYSRGRLQVSTGRPKLGGHAGAGSGRPKLGQGSHLGRRVSGRATLGQGGRGMAGATQYLDSLVKEFLLYRGFTNTLRALDTELR